MCPVQGFFRAVKTDTGSAPPAPTAHGVPLSNLVIRNNPLTSNLGERKHPCESDDEANGAPCDTGLAPPSTPMSPALVAALSCAAPYLRTWHCSDCPDLAARAAQMRAMADSEAWFITVHVAIEGRAAAVVGAVLDCVAALAQYEDEEEGEEQHCYEQQQLQRQQQQPADATAERGGGVQVANAAAAAAVDEKGAGGGTVAVTRAVARTAGARKMALASSLTACLVCLTDGLAAMTVILRRMPEKYVQWSC